MRNKIRNWLNEPTTDYNAGKNVESIDNSVYVAAIREFINEGHTVEFPVRGWSMRIFVEHERDKAVLAPCDKNRLKRGDVVLADTGGRRYVLHRIIKTDGDKLTLMGDGNTAGTETCHRADVVAIVTAFRRKGHKRLDSTNGLKWRCYSTIWMALLPVRRQLILAWRLLMRLHIIK